jgi:phage gp37-like protein
MVKLAEIENAILDLVKANLPYLNDMAVPVADEHFDDLDNIIAPVPAVLAAFTGSEIMPATVRGLANDYAPIWKLAAGASNLRGSAEEKQGDPAGGEKGVYDILDDLRALLGGRKLEFESGGVGVVYLRGEELAQFSREGTWIALKVQVQTDFENADV